MILVGLEYLVMDFFFSFFSRFLLLVLMLVASSFHHGGLDGRWLLRVFSLFFISFDLFVGLLCVESSYLGLGRDMK